ncbi:MAG TPA: malto-oligosyltrehalose trehalohydrolase [Paracoccaceae bacterium]|nr:malto-oligosyltrehalose trehalohydrolase [Paracoccaceae bacterium]
MIPFRRSWGADPIGEHRWEFRIWAPGCERMGLLLDGREHAMDKDAEGWFHTELPADPGTDYRFAPPGGPHVPDPAARAQAADVHGASVLVDPGAFDWQTRWAGRPWHEVVLYELHTGAFSPEGTFDGVARRLDHLADLGITAIELCPVAQFAGTRGWGYDGVLLYAPHVAYGGPEGLKRLIDAAHARGLMVFLDVVYNHFGPDGNYLHAYAPEFFHAERHTPWGAAIAYDLAPVRRFFVENALYWLDEYRFDGLRLDAVDQIDDPSDEPILAEIARAVREHGFDRPVHLTTEDDRNITRFHERNEDGSPKLYDGEWNDDWHHVTHVLATAESEGYFRDYADDPRGDMATALATGFVQQGRPSPFRDGAPRGEQSAHLPPPAFVNFLQNHDQTGNRAFGERLTTLAEPRAVEVLTALLLLSPHTPLLFMGEEWGETRPFQYFTDFHGDLADAVREGRRREFARWAQFADPGLREKIPDPNDRATFERSRLDWNALDADPGRARYELIQRLVDIRELEIAHRLAGMSGHSGETETPGERGVSARWRLGDGGQLRILANLGGAPFEAAIPGLELFSLGDVARDPWAIHATLEAP